MPTQDARKTLEAELAERLARLRTLRDTLRVDLNLAKLDAQEAFAKLEPKAEAAELLVKQVGHASKAALDSIIKDFEAFRASLRRDGSAR